MADKLGILEEPVLCCCPCFCSVIATAILTRSYLRTALFTGANAPIWMGSKQGSRWVP